MPLRRASPEEKSARGREKAERERDKALEREQAARVRMREDFFKSPAGQARVAFETGARVFQLFARCPQNAGGRRENGRCVRRADVDDGPQRDPELCLQ